MTLLLIPLVLYFFDTMIKARVNYRPLLDGDLKGIDSSNFFVKIIIIYNFPLRACGLFLIGVGFSGLILMDSNYFVYLSWFLCFVGIVLYVPSVSWTRF